jgi:hypothetical protein
MHPLWLGCVYSEMENCEILDPAGMNKRRTLADALTVLESLAGFGDDDAAQIRVMPIPLAPGRAVGAMAVVFEVPCSDRGYAVPLPTAEFFTAYGSNGLRVREPVKLLDQARVDATGRVCLANGELLRGLEVKPVRLPLEPTELDWRILGVALRSCRTSGAPSPNERENERRVIEKCYRPLRQAIPPKYAADIDMFPDISLLDCSALNDLQVPSLQAIAASFKQMYPRMRVPSRQKIADTLADFRIRFPRHS